MKFDVNIKKNNSEGNQFIDCFFYGVYSKGSLLAEVKISLFDWDKASSLGCHKQWALNGFPRLKGLQNYVFNGSKSSIELSGKLRHIADLKDPILFVEDIYFNGNSLSMLALKEIFNSIISDYFGKSIALFVPNFKRYEELFCLHSKSFYEHLASLGIVSLDDFVMIKYMDAEVACNDFEEFRAMVR